VSPLAKASVLLPGQQMRTEILAVIGQTNTEGLLAILVSRHRREIPLAVRSGGTEKSPTLDELSKMVMQLDAYGMRETPDEPVPCRPQIGLRTRPTTALLLPMAIVAAMTIRLEPLPAPSARARIAESLPRERHNSPLSSNYTTTISRFPDTDSRSCLYNPLTSSFDVRVGFIELIYRRSHDFYFSSLNHCILKLRLPWALLTCFQHHAGSFWWGYILLIFGLAHPAASRYRTQFWTLIITIPVRLRG
jgi:hypothetical protein